jgi:hypothetical protein
VNTSPNSLPANPTAQIGSSFAIASYSRWTQQVSAIILTPVHWEQQLLSSFEVSPAHDELQPAIILHHEFSQPSWPSGSSHPRHFVTSLKLTKVRHFDGNL